MFIIVLGILPMLGCAVVEHRPLHWKGWCVFLWTANKSGYGMITLLLVARYKHVVVVAAAATLRCVAGHTLPAVAEGRGQSTCHGCWYAPSIP